MKTFKELLNEMIIKDFPPHFRERPIIGPRPRFPHDGPHCPHPDCPHEKDHWFLDPRRPIIPYNTYKNKLEESSSHDEIVDNLTGGSIDDGITGHGFRQALKAGYSKDKIIDILKKGWGHGEERFRRGGTAHEVYDYLDRDERPIKSMFGGQYLKRSLNIGIRTRKLNPEDHLPDHHLQTEKEWKQKYDKEYGS
jgi:hypothetical protein